MDIDFDGGSGNAAPCNCSCPFCCIPDSLPSAAGARSLKRKLDEMDDEAPRTVRVPDVDRVEIENESAALLEAVVSHHQLHSELEEERAASATAASEAMSMILRLQREKADALMDARQFKSFAEEKMVHDQQEIALLEDLLFQQDQAMQSLSCEIQSYRHRLLSFGINLSPSELSSYSAAGSDAYPPLCCESADFPDNQFPDNQYASGDIPRDHLQRIPSFVTEKVVIGNGYSPCRPLRRLSFDSFGSPSFGQELAGNNEFPATLDRASYAGGSGKDGVSDRVYTVDAVHGVDGMGDDHMSTRREFVRRDGAGGGADEPEMKRLYMRLQALEADKESMRQAILLMGTDKAQLVLLKEIAQKLSKEVMPERRVVKKPSLLRSFPIISAIKWVTSFFFRRKKTTRIKYTFGISSHNVGLLILLEKSQPLRQRRCLTRVQR